MFSGIIRRYVLRGRIFGTESCLGKSCRPRTKLSPNFLPGAFGRETSRILSLVLLLCAPKLGTAAPQSDQVAQVASSSVNQAAGTEVQKALVVSADDESGSGESAEPTTGTPTGLQPQPDLFHGSLVYSVPVQVPPGRDGLQPNLTIRYQSGSGATLAGVGWGMDFSTISRSTKHGVSYLSDSYQYSDQHSFASLYAIQPNVYRARIDRTVYRYRQLGAPSDGLPMWIIDRPGGGKLYLGETSNSRTFDPSNPNHI